MKLRALVRFDGELHTVGDEECPLGRPNCRDCGDPEHAAACRAAGHCPLCGTLHGVVPRSQLARMGLSLESLDARPTADDRWDKAARRFVRDAGMEQPES